MARTRMRRFGASLCSLAAASAFLWLIFEDGASYVHWREMLALSIPTSLCLLAAAFVHHRHLGSQILVRGTWWSNLILGMLIATTGGGDHGFGLLLALGCGSALLFLGRAGLGNDVTAARFTPAAFRGSLIVAMVMALADTESLLLFGTIEATQTHGGWLPLFCAGVMMLAIYGLSRLAVWGLALNLVSNIGIAILGCTGMLHLPEPVIAALVTTAVLQALLPVPLVLGILRRKPLLQRRARNYWPLMAAVIVVMMGLSLLCTLLHCGWS
ncbi:hypothetical protein [Haliangium ochraceum]|nr:hypothetical protein [Haliangium ochraceum]